MREQEPHIEFITDRIAKLKTKIKEVDPEQKSELTKDDREMLEICYFALQYWEDTLSDKEMAEKHK